MTEPPWSSPPPDLRLAAGVVDVWRADLSGAAAAEREWTLLSPDEQQRAARFARPELRGRWAYGREILRELLGRYTGADPVSVRFVTGPHGKPGLSGEGGDATVRFNMSHSGGIALYAFALDREVGVDVELPRRAFDVEAIAQRTFGPAEAARLSALEPPQREQEFLRGWVRYEALLKCRGTGIGAAETVGAGVDPWLCELDLGAPAAAALAVEGTACEVRRWQWRG